MLGSAQASWRALLFPRVEQEWLPAGLRDNEQVAIDTLLFRGGLPGARVLRTHFGGGSNAFSWLFGVPLDGRKAPLYVRWRLLLDELRTRLVPAEQRYLPGDFPEAALQSWAASRTASRRVG
ncbi:MAG: hypothetical protein MO852_00160 [Candidatus Devosia euplotis]|nr:hypothetical protein [Candidatus Devosia euplotis]